MAALPLRRAGTIARALAAQLRDPVPPAPERLDLAACARALESAGARVAGVNVSARREPWTATGLDAARGAPLTWLAHGDSWIGSRRGLHLDAALQLRLRTGGAAPALHGTGPTHTAAAPNDGPVEICSIHPAELKGPDEQVAYDNLPRAAFRGGFDVVVGAWPPDADVGERLARAATDDPTGLCRREAERLARPVEPPPGWEPHPLIPLTGLHTARGEAIDVDAGGRVEIVRREARVPLSSGLELRWRWRMDSLPGTLAEDTLLSHDYLSVAVEFDDGKDLTYYWSAALPVETSFRCPLPHWRHREWHMVVRSGGVGLGEWRDERRLIAPDRTRAIGGAEPREVVAVWLIATGMARRRDGRGSYADIELVDGDRALRVL